MAKQPKPQDTKAEELVAAAAQMTAAQPDVGETPVPEDGTTLSEAVRAMAETHGDIAPILPTGTEPVFAKPTAKDALRWATATTRIDHNGEQLDEDDPVFVTKAQFVQLVAAGAVAETDWDDLDEL